jgi:hypothetical protein
MSREVPRLIIPGSCSHLVSGTPQKYVKNSSARNRRQILNLNRYLARRALGYRYYYGARLISVQESPTHLVYAVSAQTRSLWPHHPKDDLELAPIDHDTTEE